MKVLILGAGVVGTTLAWYLARDGHEVEVAERRDGPGLETSFANGGQISVSHAEPWANPDAPLKLLKWLWREDSPLLFRWKLDPQQWTWGARFLFECQAWRTRDNMRDIVRLALYSRELLRELRAETGIEYDGLQRGILHFFTERGAFDRARENAPLLARYGLELEVKTPEEAVAIEPALAGFGGRIVGATYAPSDESGDAQKFSANLAKLAAAKGARFLYGRHVLGLRMGDGRVQGVVVREPGGEERTLAADAYVVALGSYSPLLTRPIGIDLPIYPTKGYSASIDIVDESLAPTVCLTDEEMKLAISRLGNVLRMAGTAELAGYSTELNLVRCEAIVRRGRELFPGAGDFGKARFWTGLRPSTPSNVPLVGATRYPNLYLDTGHGTLGWTLACGSGKALADIISGRQPGVELRFAGRG